MEMNLRQDRAQQAHKDGACKAHFEFTVFLAVSEGCG